MKVLGIETATLAGGVALIDETRLIAEYRLHVEVRHSERLLSTIDHLMTGSGISLADLDGIAVSIGPGSFTGLRVCLATAKGLAFGIGKPLALVPTLEGMAAAFPYCKAPVSPWLDARRGEVYWGLFDYTGAALARLRPDAATSPEQVLDEIKRLGREILFIGEGAIQYREKIVEALGERALFPPPASHFPSSAAIAERGLFRLLKGETVSPEEAAPIYLRASTAESKWDAARQTEQKGSAG